MEQQDAAPVFIPTAEVKEMIGIRSNSYFWKLAKDPEFPKPIRKRGRRWVLSEVAHYVDVLMSRRKAA